jgi:hypothetical protein
VERVSKEESTNVHFKSLGVAPWEACRFGYMWFVNSEKVSTCCGLCQEYLESRLMNTRLLAVTNESQAGKKEANRCVWRTFQATRTELGRRLRDGYNIHRKLHEAYGMSSQPGAKAGARCAQRVAGRKSPCRPLWLNTWSPSILSVVQCPPVCPVKPAPSLSKWWIDLCLQVPCHNPNPSPNRRLSSS